LVHLRTFFTAENAETAEIKIEIKNPKFKITQEWKTSFASHKQILAEILSWPLGF